MEAAEGCVIKIYRGKVIWEGKREVVFMPKGKGLRVGIVKGGKWFVLNNEVFETGCDDKLLEVAERAVVRNKGLAAEGKQPCVGTIWAPDDFWKMEIAERGAYLDGLKRLGVVILMSDWADEGWKAKKKNDGNWEFTPIG